jgi:hypothetical protein
MDYLGNFEEPNNTLDRTDLNQSLEATQTSVDSTLTVQTGIEESETLTVTQPQTTQEQKSHDDGGIGEQGEQVDEIELTSLERYNRAVREGLKKKYPHIFETIVLPDKTTVDLQRKAFSKGNKPLKIDDQGYLGLTDKGVIIIEDEVYNTMKYSTKSYEKKIEILSSSSYRPQYFIGLAKNPTLAAAFKERFQILEKTLEDDDKIMSNVQNLLDLL